MGVHPFEIARSDMFPRTIAVGLKVEQKDRIAVVVQQACAVYHRQLSVKMWVRTTPVGRTWQLGFALESFDIF